MGRGQFEDIFEECLSALLEGRRSIEESLSLYPAWRGRLEPLLRAAEEIAGGLDATPSPYAKERGLQRFLDSARARRRRGATSRLVSGRDARSASPKGGTAPQARQLRFARNGDGSEIDRPRGDVVGFETILVIAEGHLHAHHFRQAVRPEPFLRHSIVFVSKK